MPATVRRALWSRDSGCAFPGCHNKRFVDAHHIQHWSAGDETSLDNLMLLCTRHHRLVHEGGFSIEKDYLDRWMFKRPDGIAVPSCGYQYKDSVDDGIDPAESVKGVRDSAESYLTKRKKLIKLPMPPPYTARCCSTEQVLRFVRSALHSKTAAQMVRSEQLKGSASDPMRISHRHMMCVWKQDDFSYSVLVRADGEIVEAETTDS